MAETTTETVFVPVRNKKGSKDAIGHVPEASLAHWESLGWEKAPKSKGETTTGTAPDPVTADSSAT